MADEAVETDAVLDFEERLRSVTDSLADSAGLEAAVLDLISRLSETNVSVFCGRSNDILDEARAGRPSVLDDGSGERVVVMSAKQLASIVAGARKPRSFAGALMAIPGFVGGHEPVRLVQRQRSHRTYRIGELKS